MKRFGIVFLLLVSSLAGGWMIFFHETEPYEARIMREELFLELPEDTEILISENTYGGFHGDGHLLCIYQLSETGMAATLSKLNKNWHPAPVPDALQEEIEQSINMGREESDAISLDCKKGYFLFRDRYDHGRDSPVNPYSDQFTLDAYSRYSDNFTFGFINKDTSRLYFYMLDT